jgi:hypothetical protein
MAQIALIVPLGDLPGGGAGIIDPGYGVRPGGGRPDNTLPGGGLYPGHELPGGGGTPGQLPAGGTDVPPDIWPQPPMNPLPPNLESQIVVAVHRPGQPWVVKSYPVAPSQGLPGQAQPKV